MQSFWLLSFDSILFLICKLVPDHTWLQNSTFDLTSEQYRDFKISWSCNSETWRLTKPNIDFAFDTLNVQSIDLKKFLQFFKIPWQVFFYFIFLSLKAFEKGLTIIHFERPFIYFITHKSLSWNSFNNSFHSFKYFERLFKFF